MNDASTWYHPDLFGEFAGVKRYVNKEYTGAMKYFEIGAYYADKFSQLSIGLMYVNGEGVPKDMLTGYAWIDIAAERDYPDFVATRDRVKAALTPDELQRAQAIRDKLALRYADKVAKPRMEQQLRFGREQMTGSHLGFDQGVKHDSPKGTLCKGSVFVGGIALAGSRLRRRRHLRRITLEAGKIFRAPRFAVEGDGHRRRHHRRRHRSQAGCGQTRHRRRQTADADATLTRYFFPFSDASRAARNSLSADHCGHVVSSASRLPTAYSACTSSITPDRSQFGS